MATPLQSFSLSDLFQYSWDILNKIETGQLTTSHPNYKESLNDAIQYLFEADSRIDQLGLFSRNEDIEEVSSTNLRYLLVSGMVGYLVYQLMDDRMSHLTAARDHMIRYLHRCHDYSLTSEEPPVVSTATTPGTTLPKTLEQLKAERQMKITQLKTQKELERKLNEFPLSAVCDVTTSSNIDEEMVRDYWMGAIRLWMYRIKDIVSSIDKEMTLLRDMNGMSLSDSNRVTDNTSSDRPMQPFKPFTITKDMIKSKVFGAGYPSLPTVSLEEFYEQTYKNQVENYKKSTTEPKREEEEEEEDGSDSDDEEKLKKAREFDDYKDDHRRGWGNRTNMG